MQIAVQIARELQEKNLYVFMGGCTNGKQFAEQLAEEGVQLGWDTRLVPFGRDVSALIYALGFANRAALSFGGVKPGDFAANLKYNKNRIFAFVLALGEVDAREVRRGGRAPSTTASRSSPTPTSRRSCRPASAPTSTWSRSVPYETMVEKALEVRGCKVKITKVPIPVPYGPAFEGERIRKADAHVEFGGNKTTAFEFVTMVDLDQINDGEIEVIGPDIDSVEPGAALPLAIWVEVAGRKMQPDFEPILERQIHHLVNGAEGIWHMGQRDIVWTRVSKAGFAKGLRLRHYGEILHAKLLSDYPAIVDKVKVTLVTDAEEVQKRLAVARKVYDERNRRLESMTDESVDTFYSCLLCQSFAPNHVCVITPERLGLCGAYNWLDGKAAYEIDETGPNQPIKKGECLDPVRGIWKGVNDYVYPNSHKTIDCFSAYSIMDHPMTSCGCFEAICAYVPECNGVMVVNREFLDDTPVGMTFSTLAGSVGGGQQTPGFMGCGKVFLTSRKFLFAEGGHRRLIWMPKELKNLLAEDLKKRCQEQGAPDLLDKIADETIATDPKADPRLHGEGRAPGAPDARHERRVAVRHKGPSWPPPRHRERRHASPAMPKASESAGKDADAAGGPGGAAPRPSSHGFRHARGLCRPDCADQRKGARGVQACAGCRLSRGHPARCHGGASRPGIKATGPCCASTAKDDFRRAQPRNTTGRPWQAFGPRTSAPRICRAPASPRHPPVSVFPLSPPSPRAKSAARCRSARSSWAPCARKAAPAGAPTASAAPRPCRSTSGKARCPTARWWPWRCSTSSARNTRASCATSTATCCSHPAEMAKACVEKYGADLISVRLEGTHPEKGNRTPEQAVELVKSVLAAVDVPLIITGHNHFDRNNEVLKAVAAACAGENLLLNWVEQNNYRTIAGAAMAYGHCVVSQSPIDVNIGKQMNILLTNMDLKREQIVMDPLTGAMGYGIEYTYSVMERIRLTGLGGDAMLALPMIVSPGQECAKIKELKASEKDMPAWGDLRKRAALWELTTAMSLLYAGADILIMYNPEAVAALKRDHHPPDGQPPACSEPRLERDHNGSDRSTNPEAPARHQLQGVRLQHLPGVRHEAGRQEGRAVPVPLCLRRSQARAGRGQRAAGPMRRARARPKAQAGRRSGAVPPREDLRAPDRPGAERQRHRSG